MVEEGDVWFGGVEPVEIGNLDEVKETRTVIPATKGVKFNIKKVDNSISKDNNYRSLNLQLQLVDGLDAEGKYKNKVMFGRVCYYADPTKYTKDFFRTRQHLVQLKYLMHATGVDLTKIDGHKLDELTGKIVYADITIRKRTVLVDDGTGTQVEQEQLENEIKNFKAVPVEEQV